MKRPSMDDDYSTPGGGQGYPVNTALYDATGYGDIDDEKSQLLAQLLKLDRRGVATIAAYTNRLSNDPMSKYLGLGGGATGAGVNLLAIAQDRYIQENRARLRNPMTYRQAKSITLKPGMNTIKMGG